MNNNNTYELIHEIVLGEETFKCSQEITQKLSDAQNEITELDETIASLQEVKPHCDKIDYMLAACSGALCGVIDVLFVGAPNFSELGKKSDKWFSEITKKFAQKEGWSPKDGEGKLENAINFLEGKYGNTKDKISGKLNIKIPYDQTTLPEDLKNKFGFNTNATKHHFQSLAHNPTLAGLLFSILDQFEHSSHFVIQGKIVVIRDTGGDLYGNTVPAKLLCAFRNWFGHLMSDISGSYKSAHKGNRGTGVPAPLYAWVNDIIVIKNKLGIKESELDKLIDEWVVRLFTKGFDLRFMAAQSIPVVANELITRFMYFIRRLISYFSDTSKQDRSFKEMMKRCSEKDNATVEKMLLVAHGTFCAVDIADASIRGCTKSGGNWLVGCTEFLLRVNIVGVGRLTLCLYKDIKNQMRIHEYEWDADIATGRKKIIEEYIQGLKRLAKNYDNFLFHSMISNFENGEYETAFKNSISDAEKWNVPEGQYIKTTEDRDNYFLGHEN